MFPIIIHGQISTYDVNSANSSSKSEVMLNRMIHITISNIELSNQQFDKQVH